MTELMPIALIGWIPVVLLLFAAMPRPRAVVVAVVVGWLFLPTYSFGSGAWQMSKATSVSGSLLLAAVIFDLPKLMAIRPRLIDLPMLVWTLAPVASSLANGLGLKDGIVSMMGEMDCWIMPYVVGRAYFTDWGAARELALGIFIGAMVYIPLCLYEIRMSPQLHSMLYGFSPLLIFDVYRFGGWRPNVFMSCGLELGFWMTSATLLGLWLWRTGSVRRIGGVPMGLCWAAVLATTVLCRAMGATALLVVGLGLLYTSKIFRTPWPMLVIVACVGLYMGARATDPHGGLFLVDAAAMIDPARADSLRFRMINEDMLVQKAMEQPVFGWGGWGRSRIFSAEAGRDVSITDSLWIIVIGMNGIVGLSAVFLVLLTPLTLAVRRLRWAYWSHPLSGVGCVFGLIVGLFSVDCLFNAMLNPVYMIMAGAIVSLTGPRRGMPAAAAPAVRHTVPAAAGAAWAPGAGRGGRPAVTSPAYHRAELEPDGPLRGRTIGRSNGL